jgi:hypothetical protein
MRSERRQSPECTATGEMRRKRTFRQTRAAGRAVQLFATACAQAKIKLVFAYCFCISMSVDRPSALTSLVMGRGVAKVPVRSARSPSNPSKCDGR